MALSLPATGPSGLRLRGRLMRGRALPVLAVTAVILVVWYAAAVWLNAPRLIEGYGNTEEEWTAGRLVADAWAMERPVLPAPHQVVAELWRSTVEVRPSSPRSLLYHAGVTLASTLLGFGFGTVLGIGLAVAIVHVRTLETSLLPWIITSQTIPILAIAPMVIVVLGSMGIKGVVPKAVISTYLCFFPVAVGMVKGLRAPERLELDLMRTYNASAAQTLSKLRWPAALPFLFTSLKVAVSISLVGAIVGELPTGAQAGLGARLLVGSYYGQTVQIWAALVMASLLAALLIGLVDAVQRVARVGPPA